LGLRRISERRPGEVGMSSQRGTPQRGKRVLGEEF